MFRKKLKKLASSNHDLKFFLKAAKFSAEKHGRQFRKGKDRSPYINHPLEVAELLADIGGVTDIKILAAAVLHDTVEDTETTPEEIERHFGPDVRALVEELSDDKTLPKDERKRFQVAKAPRLSSGAKLIKIADKIANVRELIHNPPADWSPERRKDYLEWAAGVVAGCRGAHPGLERRFEEVLREGRFKINNGK